MPGDMHRNVEKPSHGEEVGSALRIALLGYRSDPRSGGQGVYIRNLSRELTALGHHVTVFSGPPYPDVDPGVVLVQVPSLELYEAPGPFKNRSWAKIRSVTDVREFGLMFSGQFPEPRTFTDRVAARLKGRRDEFDIVHDNQSLGSGLLTLQRSGWPVISTIHHPLTVDLQVAIEHIEDPRWLRSIKRWYSFLPMQMRVASSLPVNLTVSERSRTDIAEQMGVPSARLAVVPVGTDPATFRPTGGERIEGRLFTTASADVPLKGLVFLLEALAKVRTERPDAHLVVLGRGAAYGPVAEAIERFDITDAVRFVTGISDEALVQEYALAQVAVVPSLYEGFGLPVVEAMACGVPVVATTGGALPEVVGPDGEAGLLVPPADAGALAIAIGRVLADPLLGARLGAAGRERVLANFTWRRCAESTVRHYRETIAGSGRGSTV